MQFDYSVSSMLPFARAAIRETSDFSPQQFTELLFDQLANANVPGVVRQGPPAVGRYNFSDLQMPYALKQGVIEIFWHLVHRGFILPEAQSFPQDYNRGRYRKTRMGTAWASETSSLEPLPEDVRGYMTHLSSIVPGVDPIVRQYVHEGLGSFEREMYFSAAVMLGAASEKEIYLLGASVATALKTTAARKKLAELVEGRSLYRLLDSISAHVATCKNPRNIFDGAQMHLFSLFESIRVQRNDAVHPNTATVDEKSVRWAYQVFPAALQKAEALRTWFQANPNSV